MVGNPGVGSIQRVISVNSRDNLANRMMQFMVALSLQARIDESVITGVHLPEWGIELGPNPSPGCFEEVYKISLFDTDTLNIRHVASMANGARSINIILNDYMQRMEFLDARNKYAEIFRFENPAQEIADDELLINIRAGDILCGVPHYPLLPVAYHKWLVEMTGLTPVFCGQLEKSIYSDLLRSEFSGARFIDSQGPIADFQLIRSARYIAPSVSTFSWLAAWLSQADTIFLPLCGFLNPSHDRNVNLLPVSDNRYRFFLFPLYFGLPEAEMLAHHRSLQGSWKEISPSQVAVLKTASPFLAPRTSNLPFDPIWYAHTYIDAAKEISEGWFRDPLHHYLEVGRLRDYAPTRVAKTERATRPAGTNLALGKCANQSSISEWSVGKTPEEDAGIAVDGRIWMDKYFHTDRQENPWWSVDLGELTSITAMRIFNRDGPEFIRKRAMPLVVEAAVEANQWFELFRTDPNLIIGGMSGGPLVWHAHEPIRARYVRVVLPREEFLHLAEVEVYGI